MEEGELNIGWGSKNNGFTCTYIFIWKRFAVAWFLLKNCGLGILWTGCGKVLVEGLTVRTGQGRLPGLGPVSLELPEVGRLKLPLGL